MASIGYMTDKWGGKEGCVHFEVHSGTDDVLQVTIENGCVHLNQDGPVHVEQVYLNAVYIRYAPAEDSGSGSHGVQQAQPAIAYLVKKLHADYQPCHPFTRDDVIAWLNRQQQA